MKSLQITLILSVLVFSSVLPVAAQTPQEIAKSCVTALGGEEAVGNLSNYKASGDIDYYFGPQLFKGKIEVIKRGDKFWARIAFRIGSSALKVSRVFDGKNAWADQNGSIVNQPALNYHTELAHTPSLLLEKQAVFSMGEKIEIEGKPIIGLEVTFDNKHTTFFIDQSDHTLKEIRYKDLFYSPTHTKETVEKRILYEDYTKVEGFMFPSRITHYQKGMKQMVLYFHNVTFNPELPPILFKRPDRKFDLRYMEEKFE
jgi:hypothetical protein